MKGVNMETAPGINYGAVLADLKKRREDINMAIAAIEQIMWVLGIPIPPDSPDAGSGDGADHGEGLSTPPPSKAPGALPAIPTGDTHIREDAFFGMSISTASQKYLAMRKKPATAPEIAAALEAGGFPHQSANLPNTINSVLARNAVGAAPIFAKVKRGTWGLRAWYPNYRPKDDKDGD